MNLKPIFASGALLALGIFLGSEVFSQDKEKSKAPEMTPEQMAEMMKIWQEVATPGEAHKALNMFVGKWDTHSKFWMAGEGSEAMESNGSSEIKWALEGRFLMEESTGTFMGMPFKGMGLRGYDNYRKEYISFWADNMGTAMYTAKGQMDAKTKTFTFSGVMDEPTMNQKDKAFKWVWKVVDDNKYLFEMHDLDLAKHTGVSKVGEITYTRKTMN